MTSRRSGMPDNAFHPRSVDFRWGDFDQRLQFCKQCYLVRKLVMHDPPGCTRHDEKQCFLRQACCRVPIDELVCLKARRVILSAFPLFHTFHCTLLQQLHQTIPDDRPYDHSDETDESGSMAREFVKKCRYRSYHFRSGELACLWNRKPQIRSRTLLRNRTCVDGRSTRLVNPILNLSGKEKSSEGGTKAVVIPERCKQRQKWFVGFAKWCPVSADMRPGLIPQNTTSSPGCK
jgi:hypothetical protein